MFLENETWELCPVKSNFSIAQLHVSRPGMLLMGRIHGILKGICSLKVIGVSVARLFMEMTETGMPVLFIDGAVYDVTCPPIQIGYFTADCNAQSLNNAAEYF